MGFLDHFPDYVHQFELWGNTGEGYLVAGLVFLLLLTLFRTFHHALIWRLEILAQRTSIQFDDVLTSMVKRIRPWFYPVLSLYLATWFLVLEPIAWQILSTVFIILTVYQVVQSIGVLVEYFVDQKFPDENDGQASAVSRVMTQLIKGVLWLFAGIFTLSNLGINVTSLITGLGIGGVAVALALQTILGDLFSSFTIYFDKPFKIGDFIVVGDKMGTVESVGIKTTRLRALSGEEIVMSNSELTSARIHNYRNTSEFRGELLVGLSYQTKAEDLDRARDIITKIINDEENVRLDRVSAVAFADSSINFEVAFYTKTRVYVTHMATKHNLIKEIKRRFDEEGLEIAYPTRTVYLHK